VGSARGAAPPLFLKRTRNKGGVQRSVQRGPTTPRACSELCVSCGPAPQEGGERPLEWRQRPSPTAPALHRKSARRGVGNMGASTGGLCIIAPPDADRDLGATRFQTAPNDKSILSFSEDMFRPAPPPLHCCLRFRRSAPSLAQSPCLAGTVSPPGAFSRREYQAG